MLLPQEIAEQLTPDEMTDLAVTVEEQYAQAYGVVKVNRGKRKVVVEIELDDRTRHEIVLNSVQNQP